MFYSLNYTEYSNKRTSFDRLGDDLIQHILGFLSIDECFRLESVSKQWKYLIFNKQEKIIITTNTRTKMWCGLKYFEHSQPYVLHLRNKKVWKKSFILEIILSKCKFISRLSIDPTFRQTRILFATVFKKCKNLKYFYINSSLTPNIIEKNIWSTFVKNCGPTLETLNFKGNISNVPLKNILVYASNIKCIYGLNSENLHVLSENLEFLLTNIYSIGISINCIESFEKFSALWHTSKIKEMFLNFDYSLIKRNESRYKLLLLVASFKFLQKISMIFIDFTNGLHFINESCINLKEITIYGSPLQLFQKTILPSNMHKIVKLRLYSCETDTQILKNYTKLTSLTFDIRNLNDEHILLISQKLKFLTVIKMYNPNLITHIALLHLVNFPNLKNVYIERNYSNYCITDDSVCYLIENSLSIVKLHFECYGNITSKTYYSFKKRAKENPKNLFVFNFSGNIYGLPKNEFFPKNLIIICKNLLSLT